MGDTATSKSSPSEQIGVDAEAKLRSSELSPQMYEYKQELLQGAELNARYEEANKMYICHLCDFRTAFRNSLLNHQAVHSDFRPWVCAMCDYAAKRKQDLKKHLHTIHGMMVESTMLKPVASYTMNANPIPRALSRGESSEENSWDGGKVSHMLELTSTFPSSRLPEAASDASDTFPTPNVRIPSSDKAINIKQEKLENLSPPPTSSHGTLPSMSNFVHQSSRDSPDYDLPISFPPATCSDRPNISHHVVSPKFQGNAARYHDEEPNPAVDYKKISRTSVSGEASGSSPDIPLSISNSSLAATQSRRRPHTTSLDSVASRESSTVSGLWPSLPPSKFRKSFDSDDLLPCSSSVSVSHARGSQTQATFLCEHCDIMFFQRAMYLMHAGLHSSSNPWCCTVCGSTFTEKYSFTSHFINQH